MKKIILGLTLSTLLMSTTVFAQGTTKKIQIKINSVAVVVNGDSITDDNFIYNGTTYVPIRSVSNALGASVDYNKNNNTISIETGSNNSTSSDMVSTTQPNTITTTAKINSVSLYADGNKINKDTMLIDGVTYVPLRAISEALDVNVAYSEDLKVVSISDSNDLSLYNTINVTQSSAKNKVISYCNNADINGLKYDAIYYGNIYDDYQRYYTFLPVNGYGGSDSLFAVNATTGDIYNYDQFGILTFVTSSNSSNSTTSNNSSDYSQYAYLLNLQENDIYFDNGVTYSSYSHNQNPNSAYDLNYWPFTLYKNGNQLCSVEVLDTTLVSQNEGVTSTYAKKVKDADNDKNGKVYEVYVGDYSSTPTYYDDAELLKYISGLING